MALVVAAVEGVSLVRRGSRGETDVGVFYRTCVLLKEGIGGALYTRHDVVTDWPISLSPAGLALFQPLASFGPLGASIGWALINLALLGVSIVALRRFLTSVGSARLDVLFPWAAIDLSCWRLPAFKGTVQSVVRGVLDSVLVAFVAGSYFGAGVFLAIPTAIKLYPVMMLAVPISLMGPPNGTSHSGRLRAGPRHFSGSFLRRIREPGDLNVSFWENVILNPTDKWRICRLFARPTRVSTRCCSVI